MNEFTIAGRPAIISGAINTAAAPNHESDAGRLREAIVDATLAELRLRGIDEFSIGGVAERAGVDPREILRIWPDRRVLLVDAQIHRAAQLQPIPDTGTLAGDLRVFTAALARVSQSAEGRRWYHRTLPSGHDADLAGIREDFWRIRFDAALPILLRAAERGELRDGVDPVEAIRMLAAAYNFDVIFNDSPIRPNYAVQTLDIFIRGISG